MMKRPFSPLTLITYTLVLLFALLFHTQPALAALGWVGDMSPAGGSSSTIAAGSSHTVSIQVWKNGVTPGGGQGANISCTLYWGQVSSFGGGWANITSTAMTYHDDLGNNDRYQVAISPGAGLYEYTAYCTDLTDSSQTWRSGANGMLTVNTATTTPTDARAFWADEETIAWNTTATSYELHYAAGGTLAVPNTAGSGLSLTFSGTLTSSSYASLPNVAGYRRLLLPATLPTPVKTMLKGETAVAAYNSNGDLIDTTWLQHQAVLDDLYATNAANVELGVTYSSGVPTVRVWAPTAVSVTLRRFANATTSTFAPHPMTENTATGVWSVVGDGSWDREFYLFAVEVFVPGSGIVTNLVTDPYAVSLSMNSTRSQFVDLANDSSLEPASWPPTKPALNSFNDISIYEVHVRDFSINDSTVPAGDRGTFKAFTHTSSNGMTHLLNLQDAGLTHIHLLPAFDIASVNEDASARVEPSFSFNPATDRDSEVPQAAVVAAQATDGFNWGYDPYHYGVPEGSYSTNPNGVQRIIEFRQMVQTLNANGLRVVMDVVYNHTNSSGLTDTSVLDKVVPGYYHRYNNSGVLQTTSCCPDTASEFAMMEKLMIDTLKRWATVYQVDGFRFDLMNLHTVQNSVNIRDAIQGLTVANDGVDGSKIFIYGEGWDFGSAQAKGLTHATQANLSGTGIGTFNDRIRDAAHGGFTTDPLQIRHQGFINGLSYDWNGYSYNNRAQSDLHTAMDRLRTGLVGGLSNWGNGGYTTQPVESINYVSKHDNETLYDLNIFKLPSATSMADRVRAQNMGLSLIGLSQGVPFFHMGSDMLRSKSLDRNSYDSGDWFNKVDFSYQDNNFGKGVPPAADNAGRWSIMKPLLANTALSPAAANIQNSAAHMQEILQIRSSSPLFRLTSAAEINSRVTFFNSDNAQDALIVMGISDAVGADLDGNTEYIFVLFNAHKNAQTFTIAEMAGVAANAVTLHPVLQSSNDGVVQTSSFNHSTGTFSVPARTTAVFLSTVAPTTIVNSNIDYVGSMYPAGDVSNAVNLGSNSGHTVYIQVYEPGVTNVPGGSGGNIDCYLHWGKYGQSWTDSPMTFNSSFNGNANNDEHYATIPTAGLTAGQYGYTAYCTDDGGISKKWRSSSEGGDGILTVLPVSAPPPGTAFVHLFEWKWSDIAKECSYLADKGYSAVQVSPPMEHVVPTAADSYAWWVRYQPISYSLGNSRSGTLAEFQNMVTTCNNEGVDIYVDAVINHMTGVGSGTGSNGSSYTAYDYPAYDPADFHYCGTNPGGGASEHNINDYNNRSQVQSCELVNLADLDTNSATVQATIRAYLQALINMGVAGFRLDASKHMASQDIAAILSGLTGNPYIYQEVIDVGNEPVQAFEYLPNGAVTEFNYSAAMGTAFNCGGTLSALATLGTGLLPSNGAVVFTDNHDNQRGHGAGGACIVDHRDGTALYNLANIFVLAYPYGYPQVMSSYHWDGTDDDAGPPSTVGVAGSGPNTLAVYGAGQVAGDVPQNCDGSHWVCEHRRTAVANMVAFRAETNGQAVTNWWDNGANQIAFGRGSKGYVALNYTGSSLTRTFATGLAAGTYCDVTKGELNALGTGCTGPAVTVDGSGNIVGQTVAAMDAFAIHTGAKVAACTATAPTAVFPLTTTPASPSLTLSWTDFGGPYQVRVSTTDPYFAPASGTLLATPSSSSYTHTTALGTAGVHHFYVVQANNCAGAADSARVAAFTFLLVPGQ